MAETPPSLYDAIGVSADASPEEIKRTARARMNEVKLSDKPRSEKNELIRFFRKARDTLTDPAARQDYDLSIGIETVTATQAQDDPMLESMVPFEAFQPFHQSMYPCRAASSALGVMGSLFGLGHDEVCAVSAAPRSSASSSSSPPPPPSQSQSPSPSSLMAALGAGIDDLFSGSIVPEELARSAGGLKSGSFQVLEYTKVRNPDGGYDEFGFTRHGDVRSDRVTEKRFQRKS